MRRFLTALLLCCSLPASANTLEDHGRLITALEQAGIEVSINDPEFCRDKGVAGMYYSERRALVICQDKGGKFMIASEWTENDLDTLRHEAHHVLQDCVQGVIGDNQLAPIYSPEELREMAAENNYNPARFDEITTKYRAIGASEHVVLLEHEAWYVASMIPASNLTNTLTNFCNN